MPTGRQKSRSLRRVFVKLPGGSTKLSYRQNKPSPAKCADCGAKLAGIPREKPSVMQKMPKTQKRPERPYGGNLCPKCSRRKIVDESR